MTAPQPYDWHADALCRRAKRPDVMYPPADHPARVAMAKQWCQGCPVTDACREWALERREEFGVWGGLSEGERRRIWRGQARQAVA